MARLLFTCIILMNGFFGKSQVDSLKKRFARNNICMVETIQIMNKDSFLTTTHFDKQGRMTMVISKTGSWTFSTFYEFKDSLLISLVTNRYNDGNLMDSSVSKWVYGFDANGKINSNMNINPEYGTKLTTFTNNQANGADTIVEYEGPDSLNLKLTLTTYITYQGNTTIYKKCSPTSPRCDRQIATYTDKLQKWVDEKWMKHGDEFVLENDHEGKLLYDDEGDILEFENNKGFKTIHEYVKDETGLIKWERVTSISPNNKPTVSENYSTYFTCIP